MTSPSSDELQSYLPVYDAIPEKWEEAKEFLTEALKEIANAVNNREIGFFLDEELLSGKAFIPGVTIPGNNPGVFRSILRKVINVGPLVAGLNAGVPHGINFDTNFTLIDLWVSGTNTLIPPLNAKRITGNDVNMNQTQIIITSPQAFDKAFAFVEYVQEA